MHQRSLTNTEMSGDCHLVKLRIKRARIISRFGMHQRQLNKSAFHYANKRILQVMQRMSAHYVKSCGGVQRFDKER